MFMRIRSIRPIIVIPLSSDYVLLRKYAPGRVKHQNQNKDNYDYGWIQTISYWQSLSIWESIVLSFDQQSQTTWFDFN